MLSGEKATLAQGAELEFWGSGGPVRNCVSVGVCLIYRVIPSLSSSQVILVTSSD